MQQCFEGNKHYTLPMDNLLKVASSWRMKNWRKDNQNYAIIVKIAFICGISYIAFSHNARYGEIGVYNIEQTFISYVTTLVHNNRLYWYCYRKNNKR